MSKLAIIAMGILATVPAAAVFYALFALQNHERRETPARIAKCHAVRGTARVNRDGIYTGCLVPPP